MTRTALQQQRDEPDSGKFFQPATGSKAAGPYPGESKRINLLLPLNGAGCER